MPQYPVNLELAGRAVLLVGGGNVATRKAEGLLVAGARLIVVAPAVRPELAALSGVTIEQRPYRRGEVAGYRLVLTATDDREVNQAVFDDCEAAGIWCNSADDPDRCSFTLPAQVRRGAVLLTASTGGASPALASWLRRRLEASFGPELEELVERLRTERADLHAQGLTTEGLDWDTRIETILRDLA